MSATKQVDWGKRYKDLLMRFKSAQNKVEISKEAFEKAKLMAIETQTANMELDQIFNQSSSGIWLIDTNFEILRMNETLATLTGRRKDDVRGLKCYDVFPISICATHDCPMNKIKQGRHGLEYDIERTSGSGMTVSYLLTVNPFYGLTGKTMGLVGEFKDITLRKRAERALRAANKTLQRLSDIDGLTQVTNRRCFDEFFRIELKRANRSVSPLSLIFCDIDYFKVFNDTYGHQAGDDCLKAVARVIDANLRRPDDLVARYGGEEFILVLPDTDGKGAFHLAEIIRKALLAKKITHDRSPIASYVTLSLGVTCFTPDQHLERNLFEPLPDALIKIADQALYEAKQGGRNRTILKMANLFEDRVENEVMAREMNLQRQA